MDFVASIAEFKLKVWYLIAVKIWMRIRFKLLGCYRIAETQVLIQHLIIGKKMRDSIF